MQRVIEVQQGLGRSQRGGEARAVLHLRVAELAPRGHIGGSRMLLPVATIASAARRKVVVRRPSTARDLGVALAAHEPEPEVLAVIEAQRDVLLGIDGGARTHGPEHHADRGGHLCSVALGLASPLHGRSAAHRALARRCGRAHRQAEHERGDKPEDGDRSQPHQRVPTRSAQSKLSVAKPRNACLTEGANSSSATTLMWIPCASSTLVPICSATLCPRRAASFSSR